MDAAHAHSDNTRSIVETDDRLLTAAEVAHTLGIGESSVWRHVRKTPGFPTPIRFGRTTRWRRSDVHAFMRASRTA